MSSERIFAVLCGDLNLVRCFDGAGLGLALVTSEFDDVSRYSRAYRARRIIACPRTQPSRALADLVELGKSLHGRPALFFDNEPFMLLAARHRDQLQQYFRYLMPDTPLVEAMADKVQFAELAARHNLPTPTTLSARAAASADDALARLSLPCIFKPVSHVGWYTSDVVRAEGGKPYKALLATTPDDFRRRWEMMSRYTPDFVIQEFIPGGDELIYSFHAYRNAAGQTLGQFVGKKIRTYPRVSGVSTCLELSHDPAIARMGAEILDRLNLVGPVKFDFKRDPVRNRDFLLEINSRFTLWCHLGAACGVNLPLLAFRDLHGENVIPQSHFRTGVKWLELENDLRTFLQEHRPAGKLNWNEYLQSLRGPRVYNAFAWSDPLPALVATARAIGQRARKILRKLRTGAPPAAAAVGAPINGSKALG